MRRQILFFEKKSLIVKLRRKPSCIMNTASIIFLPIIWLPTLVLFCKNNMSLSFQLLVKMPFHLVQLNLYDFQHQFSYTTCLIMRFRITLSKTLSTMQIKVNWRPGASVKTNIAITRQSAFSEMKSLLSKFNAEVNDKLK